MSSEEVVVRFRNVSKVYSKYAGLLQIKNFLDRIKNGQFGSQLVKEKDFVALDDINFDIHAGERVGIIGHNGAGKSTTLKLISGISHPTVGTVETVGKIGGVLDLGAGFQADLTARDNIFLQGAIYGYSDEKCESLVEPIMELAELTHFLDVPLKKYSSGMKVRLGFAMAISTNPEIVLLDEVLSVGDASFKKKSIDLMSQFLAGRTLVFVSHSLGEVKRVTERVIVINKGKMVFDGPTEEGCQVYQEIVSNPTKTTEKVVAKKIKRGFAQESKIASHNLRIRVNDEVTTTVNKGDTITVEQNIEIKEMKDCDVVTTFTLKRPTVTSIKEQLATISLTFRPELLPPERFIGLEFDTNAMTPGKYVVEVLPRYKDEDEKVGIVLKTIEFELIDKKKYEYGYVGVADFNFRKSAT